MATPMVIIPQLEGYVSTLVNSGLTPASATGINTKMYEPVFEWVNVMKRLMRQPGNRDLTDWALAADGSIIKTSADGLLYTGASTLYGLLLGTIEADAITWVAIYDHAAKTFDATAALDALTRGLISLPAAAAATSREYHGVVYEQGLPFATAISLAAENYDGTDTTASDISVLAVYRTA